MIFEIACSEKSNNADGQIKLSTADIARAVQEICSFEVGSTPQTVPLGPLDSSTDSPDGEVDGIVIFFITYLFLISLFAFYLDINRPVSLYIDEKVHGLADSQISNKAKEELLFCSLRLIS